MKQEEFAQLAMYLAGFGLVDLLVRKINLTDNQILIFYGGIACISYYLFTSKL